MGGLPAKNKMNTSKCPRRNNGRLNLGCKGYFYVQHKIQTPIRKSDIFIYIEIKNGASIIF